jgi:hypothetical protein
MDDPWQEMEDWCKRQSRIACDAFDDRFMKGGVPVDDPELRRLLGMSQALGRMRSFIHGARSK